MKKLLSMLLLLSLLLTAASAVLSCSAPSAGGGNGIGGEDDDDYRPSPFQKWETSITAHWYEEKIDGGVERKKLGLHQFGSDDVCDVCRYKAIPSEGLAFELSEDGSGYVLTGMGSCKDKELVVPMRHEGKPVIRVAEKAFYDTKYIEKLVILNGVTELGKYAFSCNPNLETVILPPSLKILRERSLSGYGIPFRPSDSLYTYQIKKTIKEISFSEGLEIIENDALSGLKVRSVTLPNSVKKLGGFNGCEDLKYFNTGEGLEETTGPILNKGVDKLVIGGNVKKFGGSICKGMRFAKDNFIIEFGGTCEQWRNMEWDLEEGSNIIDYPIGSVISCRDGIIE